MNKRYRNGIVFLYCLLAAFVCLLVCSKSSPLYPINDWTDANAYLSSGKGMLAGRVMYRDLYEHKGPLLYALHALFCLIDPSSFLGVFVLEILSVALFLLASYHLLSLYGARRAALLALPFIGALMASSFSFQMGDSAEELCMPLLAWSLYSLLRWRREQAPARMGRGWLLLNGFMMGCVLWVKFTMLGFYVPWGIMLLAYHARQGQWHRALSSVGWIETGVFFATVPWLIYFGANGAIADWLKTYLYDNVFLYQDEPTLSLIARGKAMLRAGLDWVTGNPLYTVPMLLGLLWLPFGKAAISKALALEGRKDLTASAKWEIGLIWATFASTALGVFIGGKSYVYYGLILAVYLAFGALPLCLVMLRFARAKWMNGIISLCFAILAAGALSLAVTPNKGDLLKPREQTMQYRFAAIINQTRDATLLNYGFMDAGFYTACGIAPSVKYFHQTNVNLQEMYDEQARYVAEGLTDYVVTRGRQPEAIDRHYILVATEDAPPDFWYRQVYLYQNKALP